MEMKPDGYIHGPCLIDCSTKLLEQHDFACIQSLAFHETKM